MDMRMVTLENGWTGVVAGKPSGTGRSGMSGFASELNQVAEAAKQAEASQDGYLKAAYDRLSDSSKAVLGRLKAGTADVSKSEWDGLRRELKEMGLITEAEYFYTHPDIVVLGKAEDFGDGLVTVVSKGPAISFGYESAEWTGDPFQYLDLWLELLRRERDLWAEAAQPDGMPLDTSARAKQIEAHEKVSGLVKSLLELC